MNTKTTVILLVVLVVLVIAYFAVLRRSPDAAEREERRRRLLDFDVDQVSAVTLVRGDSGITLERHADDWRVTGPITARAAGERVQALLYDLHGLTWHEDLGPAEGGRLDDFGLGASAGTITLAAGKRSLVVRVGRTDDLNDRVVYTTIDGGDVVYTIPRAIADALARPLAYWRDRRLVVFDPDAVAGVRIDRPDSPTIRLARTETGWRLAEPLSDRASARSVGNLLAALGHLRAADFADDAPGSLTPYGLDHPRLAVTFSGPESGETRGVLLGSPVPGDEGRAYAKTLGEPFVYAVPAHALSDLGPDVFTLREKALTAFPGEAVTEIAIVAPDLDVLLRKDTADTWRLLKPELKPADGEAVAHFLDDLTAVSAERFLDQNALDLKALGLDEAARTTITVRLQPARSDAGDTGGRVLISHIGRRTPDGTLIYVRRPHDDFAMAAVTGIDETLRRGVLAFRDRTVLAFDRDDARDLTITHRGRTVVCERPDDRDRWSMIAPVRAGTDAAHIADILFDLSALRAERLVAERPTDLTPFGLDAPEIVAGITFKRDSKTVERALRVGKPAEGGGRYAMLADGDLVFAVSGETVAHLTAELHDRLVMDFRKAHVQAVTIRHAGQSPFTLVKESATWRLRGRSAAAVRVEAVEDVVDDLFALETDRFTAYAPADLAPFGLAEPRARVTVALASGERTILLGNALAGGGALAKTARGRAVFELDRQRAARLLRPLADYLLTEKNGSNRDGQDRQDRVRNGWKRSERMNRISVIPAWPRPVGERVPSADAKPTLITENTEKKGQTGIDRIGRIGFGTDGRDRNG